MNLLTFVFFFLLLVSVFADSKPDIQPALTLADIRACENNILIYRIDPRGQAPPGCTVSSKDPRYLKKLANYLAITLRLEDRVFCTRSFDLGNTIVTNLQAIRSTHVGIFSNSEKRCPPNMDFVL